MGQQPMDAKTRALMKDWVEQWRRVSPGLDAERFEALRQLDDAGAGSIARDLVWPMGTLGDERGGDNAEGLLAMKRALSRLGAKQ